MLACGDLLTCYFLGPPGCFHNRTTVDKKLPVNFLFTIYVEN
jgi:hypothetical protein